MHFFSSFQRLTDSEEKEFHNPPARRGFYAFPLKVQEFFLLGGNYQGLDFEKMIRSNMRKEFTVQDSDLIWHHLSHRVKRNEIIKENGSWVLTTVKIWKKAFSKESLNMRWQSVFSTEEREKQEIQKEKDDEKVKQENERLKLLGFSEYTNNKKYIESKTSLNEPFRSGPSGSVSMDSLEVFFEHKVT